MTSKETHPIIVTGKSHSVADSAHSNSGSFSVFMALPTFRYVEFSIKTAINWQDFIFQAHIRRHIGFAKQFADLCVADSRFELATEVQMGLVCFRLKGSNEINENLLKRINGRGNIHLVPSKIKETYFLRMAVCSRFTTSEDMDYSWSEVAKAADEVLAA